MMFGRTSPGACPICGAEHASCNTAGGPITSVMLPARDAEAPAVPLVAELVQAGLPAGQTTTGTYRGKGRK